MSGHIARNGNRPNTRFLRISRNELERHSRYTKLNDSRPSQKSEEYKKLRAQCHFSASDGYRALGFHDENVHRLLGLKTENTDPLASARFYATLLGRERKSLENDPVFNVYTTWGRKHEPNAIKSYLNGYPNHIVHEESIYIKTVGELLKEIGKECTEEMLEFKDLKIGATPDGRITNKSGNFESILEAKSLTPFIGDRSVLESEELRKTKDLFIFIPRKPHDAIPVIYIPQIMKQMLLSGVHSVTYISYTTGNGTSVFWAEFDREYAFEMVYWELYGYKLALQVDSTLETEEYVKQIQEVLKKHRGLDNERYKRFIQRTVEISQTTERINTLESVIGKDKVIFFD